MPRLFSFLGALCASVNSAFSFSSRSRRGCVVFLLLCLASGSSGQGARQQQWNFDSDTVGGLARGFSSGSGEWKVAANPNAKSRPNGFAQMAKNPGPVYNVALADATSFQDLDLSVELFPLAGEVDQGGGVVWRARDAENYYIARYNPLEKNFRVYKVVAGKRTQLATESFFFGDGGWHTVRITMRGSTIECYLDGKKYLTASDATFPDAGKIGLWTKADAQTLFDNLTVSALGSN